MRNYKILIIFLISTLIFTVYANDINSSDYYIKYGNQKIHLKEKKIPKKDSKGTIML